FAQRIRAAFDAPEPPVRRLLAALEAALVTLVAEVLTEADDQARAAWTADPAGAALLTRAPRHGTHGRVAAGAVRTDRVRALVRDWLSGIREAAASEPVALLVVLRVLAGEL